MIKVTHILGLFAVAASTAGAAPPTAKPGMIAVPIIGDVKLFTSPDARLDLVMGGKQNATAFDIHAKSVSITSARYDLSATRIQGTLKNKLLQTATATGDVHVDVRNPDAQQTESLTCATAVYYGASVSEPAHMHLTGPAGTVHYILHSPQIEGPADLVCDSADVKFLPDGTNSVRIDHPIGSATPIEPAPKTKAKNP